MNLKTRKKTSLYIHIPFCTKKCFYCSFVVVAGHVNRMDDYLDALEKEMGFHAARHIGSVYIGGGTPSLLSAGQYDRLHKMIHHHFDIDQDVEWTFECNPDDVEPEKITMLLHLGVNRISLGIQTFDDQRLRELGRIHTGRQAERAFRILQDQGCSNISVDLMFSFPGQTRDQLYDDLERMAGLKSQHVSIYNLNIDPKSLFYKQKIVLPSDEQQALFYQDIVAFLDQHGFRQYEISNFALDGLSSRHNQNYWLGGNYIGLGLGAHSHQDGRRYHNTETFTDYLKVCQSGVLYREEDHTLNQEERFLEVLLIGLRMNEGIDVSRLESRFQTKLDDRQKAYLSAFQDEGLLLYDQGRWKATMKGQLVLDELAVRFMH